MVSDLHVSGPQAVIKRYIVSGGTAIEAGEPVHNLGTMASGASSVNTYVLAAADTPVIGTHRFGGVANEKAELATAGTVIQQFLACACPIPYVGKITGRAETTANVDTLTELALICGDTVLIDWNATGAPDGGELYTIKDVASADTSGLEIIGGNPALSTLDVVVDARAYRHDVA